MLYQIISEGYILPFRALVYVLILGTLCSLGNSYANYRRFCRLSEKIYRFHLQDKHKLWSIIDWTAKSLILIMIIDEVGILLREQGIYLPSSELLIGFMSIPMISYILYIANIIIIVPATYRLIMFHLDDTNKYGDVVSADQTFIKNKARVCLCFSLIVLCISIVFTVIRCIIWGEFGLFESLYIEFFFAFAAVALIVHPMVRFTVMIGLFKNRYNIQVLRAPTICSVLFLSLSQTMVTKVLVLFSVINLTKEKLPAVIKLLKPKHKMLLHSSSVEYEKYLKTPTSLRWDSWNFYFLTLSFLPLLIILQCHSSPYPPTASGFPQTILLSLLYSFYMLLYPLTKIRISIPSWIRSMLWTSIALYVIYLTPIVNPNYYLPTQDPPGFSLLDAFEENYIAWQILAISLFVHISSAMILPVIDRINNLMEGLTNDLEKLKHLVKTHIRYTISCTVFILLFYMIVFFLTGSIEEMMLVSALNIAGDLYTILLLMLIIATLLGYSLYQMINPTSLRTSIKQVGGNELIAKSLKEVPTIRIYLNFNKSKNERVLKVSILILFSIAMARLLLAVINMPSTYINSETSMLLFFDNAPNYLTMEIRDDYLVCSSSDSLNVYNLVSGTREHSRKLFEDTKTTLSNKHIIKERVQQSEEDSTFFSCSVMLLALHNGEVLLHKDFPNEGSFSNYKWMVTDSIFIAHNTKKNLTTIYDIETGSVLNEKTNVILITEDSYSNGLILLTNYGNVITTNGWQSEEKLIKEISGVKRIIPQKEDIVLELPDSILVVNRDSKEILSLYKVDMNNQDAYSIRNIETTGRSVVLYTDSDASSNIMIICKDSGFIIKTIEYQKPFTSACLPQVVEDRIFVYSMQDDSYLLLEAGDGSTIMSIKKPLNNKFLHRTSDILFVEGLYLRSYDLESSLLRWKDPYLLGIKDYSPYALDVFFRAAELPELRVNSILNNEYFVFNFANYLYVLRLPE